MYIDGVSTAAEDPRTKRLPRKLLLSFFGEFLWQESRDQVRTRAVLHALAGAGVQAPAARAALDRDVKKGLLDRSKVGREVAYSLTPRAVRVLRDAQIRVHGAHPFHAAGEGWSVVLFSLPDESQPVRHRLRSLLNWEGFAPFGRGAWIAPGEVDFAALRAALSANVHADALVAFRSHVAEGFTMTAAVESIWDIAAIADAHHRFAATWDPDLQPSMLSTGSPIAMRTMLVSDWLDLLRRDPGLPPEHLPSDWPAEQSHRIFLDWQERLAEPSREEFRRVLGE